MRVLLAMPCYSPNVALKAATAFLYPTRANSSLEVAQVTPCTSATPTTFDMAWAEARNRWEAGEADAFAMIHSDVGAEMGWLDVANEERIKSGADILAAALPIKDNRGLSSTAVDNPADPWHVRRITTTELKKLPETFTDEDVGGPLLLNTGLWMCKLGPWCLETSFRFTNCIRREQGRWVARFQPEDWDFSRQCRRLGLKLAATRKIKANHLGEFWWSNQDQWGQATDAHAPTEAR